MIFCQPDTIISFQHGAETGFAKGTQDVFALRVVKTYGTISRGSPGSISVTSTIFPSTCGSSAGFREERWWWIFEILPILGASFPKQERWQ